MLSQAMILLCGEQEVIVRILKQAIFIRGNVLVLVFVPFGKLLRLEVSRLDLHAESIIKDAQLMISRHDTLGCGAL